MRDQKFEYNYPKPISDFQRGRAFVNTSTIFFRVSQGWLKIQIPAPVRLDFSRSV